MDLDLAWVTGKSAR